MNIYVYNYDKKEIILNMFVLVIYWIIYLMRYIVILFMVISIGNF